MSTKLHEGSFLVVWQRVRDSEDEDKQKGSPRARVWEYYMVPDDYLMTMVECGYLSCDSYACYLFERFFEELDY